MRKGRVYKRCRACGRDVDGRRCQRCGADRFAWGFRVDVQRKNEPRRQVHRSGFATQGDARAAMVRAQQRADTDEPEPTSMTFRTWSAQWLESKKESVRPSSWISMEGAMRLHLLAELGDVQLRHLTRALITGAYGRMGLSPKTTHNAHLVLHRCLAEAVEERLIAHNPSDRAHTLPRDSRPEMRTWTREEVRRFLAQAAGDPLGPMWRLFVMTGMRRGEVLALRREDLDLDGGFVMVRRSLVRGLDGWTTNPPKTARGRRRVDLDPATVAALRAHVSSRAMVGIDGHVFADAAGRPLDPDGVSSRFARLVRESRLPRIRLHDLRHTAATLMLAAGINPKVVSERLGHASVVITLDTYSHVLPSLQADAATALARAIDGS